MARARGQGGGSEGARGRGGNGARACGVQGTPDPWRRGVASAAAVAVPPPRRLGECPLDVFRRAALPASSLPKAPCRTRQRRGHGRAVDAVTAARRRRRRRRRRCCRLALLLGRLRVLFGAHATAVAAVRSGKLLYFCWGRAVRHHAARRNGGSVTLHRGDEKRLELGEGLGELMLALALHAEAVE